MDRSFIIRTCLNILKEEKGISYGQWSDQLGIPKSTLFDIIACSKSVSIAHLDIILDSGSDDLITICLTIEILKHRQAISITKKDIKLALQRARELRRRLELPRH